MKEALRAAQETLLIRELLEDWRMLNQELFGGVLHPPVFRLTSGSAVIGAWLQDGREMRLQREFATTHSWGRVVEVLKHEMAHQFVDEVLSVKDEGPHGRVFRSVCDQRGIDSRAIESENDPSPASEHTRGLINRIEKLLALAESDNQYEAEAAMERAQALMRTHNLRPAQPASARHYGFLQLGTPKARIFEPARQIAALLSQHFFVDCIWVSAFDWNTGRRGSVLEVCGTDENLAIAEYVYGFLWETAERLWQAHRERHNIRNQRDRRRFHTGVMRGFAEKLARSQVAAQEQGLVWIQDADLMAYFRRRHPRVRTVRRAGERSGAALEAGRSAGRQVVLNKPIHNHGSRGRRLTAGPGAK